VAKINIIICINKITPEDLALINIPLNLFQNSPKIIDYKYNDLSPYNLWKYIYYLLILDHSILVIKSIMTIKV